jgi:hypothetical protein
LEKFAFANGLDWFGWVVGERVGDFGQWGLADAVMQRPSYVCGVKKQVGRAG